jgi:release factor glutamine methyltransferase
VISGEAANGRASGALLSDGIRALSRSSDSPRADALLLLAHASGRSREWLVAHAEQELTERQARAFRGFCERRRTGEPIAYILGSAWFYGHEFLVDGAVLTPRPETEHLVDAALRFIKGPMRVLDVGSGCGAIACTIAAETNALVDATDISPAAIEIATENARRLGVTERCRFYVGNLAEPVRGRRFDCIVANLPYIPTRDLPPPPDPTSFEPRGALDGGADGLNLYRALVEALPPLLNERALIAFEVGPSSIARLAAMVRETLPTWRLTIGSDYAGLPRYVRALGVDPR